MGRWLLAAVVVGAVGGCGRAPAPAPAGTGAREAAQAFYDAVVRQDWPAAHALLDPGSQKRHGQGRLAQYRRGLGFEPKAAHVRACEERGDDAVAHVTLSGRGAAR